MNPMVVCNLAALTIALVYYVWRDAYMVRLRRSRLKHQRIALMLWTAANRGD